MPTTTDEAWAGFRDRLYSYIRSRSRTAQDADDILQDVFVKVHQSINTLDDDTRLASWLFRVTHNTIVDHYRKTQPTSSITDDLPAVEDVDGPDAEQRLAPFLDSLIKDLPSAYCDALTLTELEGLTQVEMSRRLGLSPSGAKSRVQRGRAMVRDQLLDCCHVELDRRRHIIDYEAANADPWPQDCSCAPESEHPVEFIQRKSRRS
jgi:RNA polymerase sigma-70 factor (ECF subfamily)